MSRVSWPPGGSWPLVPFLRERPVDKSCEQRRLKRYTTRPCRPRTNGKAEAFFKILRKEFFRPNSFSDLNELKEQFGGFLFEYNHIGRHGWLNHMTPFDKLQKVTGLAAMDLFRIYLERGYGVSVLLY
ncbi:MAG: transposase [Deltaproteobacteria bacterium]|nr:transposase [Deltaproteobacteria bacterium]